MTQLGTATLELRAVTGRAVSDIRSAAGRIAADLQRVAKLSLVKVSVNTETAVQAARKARDDMQAEFRKAIKVDLSGLDEIEAKIKVVTGDLKGVAADLKNAAEQLKRARQGAGSSGGGGGGGSPPVNPQTGVAAQLARDLQVANSQFERGATSLKTYLRELSRIRTEGANAAQGLKAGSAEAAQLERVMGGLSRANSKITSQSIVKLRSDLSGARAEFERAISAAGRFNFVGQRQATRAYEAELGKLEQRLRSVSQRDAVTTSQLRAVNALRAQIGSQQNALNGQFSPVGLAGNIKNALQGLPAFATQIGGSLGAAFAPAQQLTAGLGQLGAAAGPTGLAIGALAVTLGALVLGLTKAIGTASDFQQRLQDIRALTQPTTEQMKALTQATFDIGKPLGVGARDAASAVLELNKAGLSATDVIGGGLKGALELAGAAGTSTAEASQMVVSAMTAFGLESRNIPGIADVFANFANQTTQGASDLQMAIAAVGPVARDAGLSIQQFSGLMATLAQGGFKNMSDAGTSLKTMLLSLTAPVDKGRNTLKALSVSSYDASGNMKPLNSILGELRGKLVELTPEAQKQVLRNIFGQDALRAAQILLREGPKAIEANTAAMKKQGEAARVAKERLDSLQGAQKKFGAVMEQVRIQIGTPFLKPLQAIVEGATSAMQALLDMGTSSAKAFTPLASLAQAAQQALAPIAATFRDVGAAIAEVWTRVLQPVLSALYQIWTVIQTAVVTALGIVLNVVRGVFTAVAGIVSGFVGAFAGHGQSVNLTLAGMAATVADWAAKARAYIVAVGQIAGTLPVVFRGVGTGVGQILAGIVKVLGGLASGARSVFQAAGGYAMAFLRVLGNFGSGVGQVIKGVSLVFYGLALAVRSALVDRVRAVLEAGGRLLAAFGSGVQQVLQPVQQAFFTYIVKPAQSMGNFVRAVFDRVVQLLGGAVVAAGRVLAPMGRVLSALGIGIGDALQNAAQAASAAISRLIDSGASAANKAYDDAQRAAQERAANTSKGLGDIFASALNGAAQGLRDFAADNGAGAQVAQGLQDIAGGMKAVGSAASGLNGDLARTTNTLQAGLDQAGQTIRGAGSDFQAGVDTVRTGVSALGDTTQKVMQALQKDLAASGKAAQATGKAVADAASPKAMPSGTKTLAGLGLTDGGKGGKKAPQTDAQKIAGQDEVAAYKKKLDAMNLADLRREAQTQKSAKLHALVLAEIAQREREAATETRKGAAAAKSAAETREGLVREIRQSIAAFQLQAQQHKVTASSLLAFNQRMDDFRARVAKLPPELQKGTQALFDQARGLAASVKGQAEATRAVTLSGAALTKYKEALRLKTSQQLKDLEADARARNLAPQLSAVLAEQTRRANVKAAADKKAAEEARKHAAAAQGLERETRQLNERFALQVQQGKVTAESLQTYQQAIEDARAKVAQLPAALRASITALLDQGTTLASEGQKLVDRRSEIDKLRQSVQEWTLAELEAGRARVLAAGGDKEKLAILDAEIGKHKQLTEAQAAQALTESASAQAAADQTNTETDYENRKAAARGNLAQLYQIELEYGSKVQAARDAALRASIADEDRQVREKYARLLDLEGLTDERRRELEGARDREIAANATRLSAGLARNNQERLDAELDAREALDQALVGVDRDTRERLRRNALADLERRTADVEAQMAAELDAEDLTEAQKLEIRKRYQPQLLAAKRAEVDQSRQIERDAEMDRYADALEAARQQGILDQLRLQADGSYLTVRQEMEKAHTSELGRIDKQYADQYRDYELDTKREVGKAVVATTRETSVKLKEEADGRVEVQLQNLDQMTGAERAAAREILLTWKAAYAAQGEAGKAAAAQIEEALGKLDKTASRKRREAADLVVTDPGAVTDGFRTRLGSIGKAEDAESARDSAVQAFAEIRKVYTDGIQSIEAALDEFADTTDDQLAPDQLATRDGLRATLKLYQGFLTQVDDAAGAAGKKAADAFTQAQQDRAADSALALAEAQHELAKIEGRDDGPAYLAGLQAALAYWRGRLKGLAEGTPEYLDALRRITELEGKVTTAKGGSQLVAGIEQAAQLLGTRSPLQAGLKAGLDGLAAFFRAGGIAGGRGAILSGAAALVGGLVEVFRTGDEDIDQVLGTMVGGIQATLMQLAQGNWLGAVISGVATVVSTIIDIFTGGARSAKKARDEINQATGQVRFFDMGKYARVVSRGGFWGFLGFKKSEIDQEAVDIARTLGDQIYSSVSSALMDGIRTGKSSFSELGLDIRKDLGQVVLQGLVDGFMKGAVMQEMLQPFLDGYIRAMRSGNAQALAEAANSMQAALGQASGALQQFYDTVLAPAARQMGIFGSEASSGRTLGAGQELPASVQVKLRADATASQQNAQSASTMYEAVGRFERTVRRLQDGGISADLTIRQPTPELRTRIRSGVALNG